MEFSLTHAQIEWLWGHPSGNVEETEDYTFSTQKKLMIRKHLFGSVRDSMDLDPQNPFPSSSCMLFSPTEARILKNQQTKTLHFYLPW